MKGGKKDELSKDVSAFANSNGGTLIYGIEEHRDGKNKGKAKGFDYVNSQKFSSEWLEQVINSRITPRIANVQIHQIDFKENECVFVIDIPKSNTAHQAQDKKYYKRFNFQSIAMDDWEIKDIFNRGNKPDIDIKLRACCDSELVNKSSFFELDILAHNKGMIAAQYINCFVEMEREVLGAINKPEPVYTDSHVKFSFDNRKKDYFDPLLPLVYRNIGRITFKKWFFENEYQLKIIVATESSLNEFTFKSNEIIMVGKDGLIYKD